MDVLLVIGNGFVTFAGSRYIESGECWFFDKPGWYVV